MITFIIPSIRLEKLPEMYASIGRSYSGSFKVIIISPYDQPDNMMHDNVKWIIDYGSPTRCHQLALEQVDTPLVTWFCDDGIYVNGRLDEVMPYVTNENEVIVLKYLESDNPGLEMMQDIYYKFMFHNATHNLSVPNDCHVMSFAIMHTSLLKKIGGWDASIFETIAMAHCDLSIRLKKYGAEFAIYPEIMMKLEWLSKDTGDHKPIHEAQQLVDEPRLILLWKEPSDRMIIDIDNWRIAPDHWDRRFK